MPSLDLLLVTIIGLAAGVLAGRVVSEHGYGVPGDIVVGIVGVLIGGWVFGVVVGVVAWGLVGELITALVGAVILLWLLRLVVPAKG